MKRFLILLILLIPLSLNSQHGVSLIVNDVGINNQVNGCMEFRDSTVIVDVASNTWTQIKNAASDLFTLKTGSKNLTKSGDGLIINKDGIYHIMFRVSFTLDAAHIMTMGVGKNGVESATIYGKISASVSSTLMNVAGFTEILVDDAPDTLYMAIRNTTDASDPTFYTGALVVNRVRW